MYFTITHPMHSHPYNPELVSGEGIATVAAAAEAAGIHGFGFTDHPAPSQRWLEAGGHDALDPFVALGYAAANTTTLRMIPNSLVNCIIIRPRAKMVVATEMARGRRCCRDQLESRAMQIYMAPATRRPMRFEAAIASPAASGA